MNELLLGRVAFRSLLDHKGRATLTMLGIIIGIGAIIATLAIGAGAEKKIKARIASLGKNHLFIIPGNIQLAGKTATAKHKAMERLNLNDIFALKKQLPYIKKISPYLHLNKTVSYMNKHVHCEAKGGNEDVLAVIGRKIDLGTSFTEKQVKQASKTVVLGEKIAESLFEYEDPLGKKIKIDDTILTVIGINKEVKDFFGYQDPNHDVYMPHTTFKRKLMKSRSPVVHGIAIQATSEQDLPILRRQASRILRARHKLLAGDPDDFTIFDQQSASKAAEEASGILQLLLLIIASISLVVGGVGVMNIMLVSVTERTREIGIRMALGATRGLILRQFLYEAIILCLVGGILGVGVGTAVPNALGKIIGWEGEIRIMSILAAFGVTTVVGLFFGYYPAHKASKMNPADALADR